MAAVGMVVAIEVDAVLDRYGKAVHEEKLAGVNFMEYRTEYGTLYVAHSGPGEIAAAAATALLIGHYGAELIINFGVVGGLTLRELSRYRLQTVLLEAGEDVASGASKANSAIVHAGFDAKPGSLKAKYNVEGNALMEGTAKELGVPFRRNGSLVLAFTEKDIPVR